MEIETIAGVICIANNVGVRSKVMHTFGQSTVSIENVLNCVKTIFSVPGKLNQNEMLLAENLNDDEMYCVIEELAWTQ